jgi:hypothetical protein
MIRDVHIRDPYPDFLPISDPGSRGQKGTGFRIPDPQHWEGNLSVSLNPALQMVVKTAMIPGTCEPGFEEHIRCQ